ncbi:MAG TPA: TIGR03435 family protein [Acidobacteriaceae bacterium]|nr:TIGR03435 family protein [Acidobacteriaceae bacterium]
MAPSVTRPSATLRVFAGITLLAGLFGTSSAQPVKTQPSAPPSAAAGAAPPLVFELADVHPSAPRKNAYMNGAPPHAGRFRVRNASIVDLVSIAYSIDSGKVLGGPSWLDTNRYDVSAKAPATTSDDDLKLMLRALLADRFKLVLHNSTKPLPAFVMTATKGSSRLKHPESSTDAGCKTPPPPYTTTPATYSCHAETMAAFAQFLHQRVLWELDQPIVDNTGLQGPWDFDFTAIFPSRTNVDGVAILDALNSQFGLKLTSGASPLPVVIIDSVNQTPTPNPPGIAAIQIPPPPADFDVATIKPSGPDNKGMRISIRGGQLNLSGVTMRWLINLGFDFNAPMIANPPKWIDDNKFDVLAKVAPTDTTPGATSAPEMDPQDLEPLLRKLVEARFDLKWHMEDRPTDAYVLLAVNPKLKKADPLYRSGCKQGPGADGKDPRIATPILGRLLSCQNSTVAEFAQFLFSVNNGYMKTALLDETGLADRYDIVLSFSGYSQIGGINEYSLSPPPPTQSASGAPAAIGADPTGGLPLFDAIKQQLGLKIEKQKRPVPMLVIDHINEKPSDN